MFKIKVKDNVFEMKCVRYSVIVQEVDSAPIFGCVRDIEKVLGIDSSQQNFTNSITNDTALCFQPPKKITSSFQSIFHIQ